MLPLSFGQTIFKLLWSKNIASIADNLFHTILELGQHSSNCSSLGISIQYELVCGTWISKHLSVIQSLHYHGKCLLMITVLFKSSFTSCQFIQNRSYSNIIFDVFPVIVDKSKEFLNILHGFRNRPVFNFGNIQDSQQNLHKLTT